jgi:hypothetical protein
MLLEECINIHVKDNYLVQDTSDRSNAACQSSRYKNILRGGRWRSIALTTTSDPKGSVSGELQVIRNDHNLKERKIIMKFI